LANLFSYPNATNPHANPHADTHPNARVLTALVAWTLGMLEIGVFKPAEGKVLFKMITRRMIAHGN
jgi:hypothetical protein